MDTALRVVMYHYVRDLPHTPFPRIKGMLTSDFVRQVRDLKERYEMATLESAMAFLHGRYQPSRDLCLLTFDDGLKEHWSECTPVLADHGVQGLFFLITECVENQRVAPVHMNHFLMARLDFSEYQDGFVRRLREMDSEAAAGIDRVDAADAARRYRWDTPQVAAFKSFFNFQLDADLRDRVVRRMFEEYFGDEAAFSRDLYASWEQARQMHAAGMVLGGHSHQHKPLSGVSETELAEDLSSCRRLLDGNLTPQPMWPFCYPYGKKDSYTDQAVKLLRDLSFECAFSTESGDNQPGVPLFSIRRVDCKLALE
ncbi:MAG: polysaccharide deacetylase family protein [Bryobacteraceae bacterium]|nr:polysaccharide deacetylase family protein [Bryobacteraceae bacterium]